MEGKGRGREREGGRRKGRKGERDLAPQKKNPGAATEWSKGLATHSQREKSRGFAAYHTLLTSCSRWRPWSHAEGCDPRPRPDWTSRGRDGPPCDRAFCVAGPRVWNSLSSSTQSAPSLLVFRRLLKCELFHR